MTEFDKKIEYIINILNEYQFNMKFKMGADELYYYCEKYNGYIILNIMDDFLIFINEKNEISEIKETINNISDNKEILIKKLKLI